jgi:hypothetical protein
MSLKRFTKVTNLQGLGRSLLSCFFARFKGDLDEKKITLPAATLEETEYFKELSKVFMSEDVLPNKMVDSLHSIVEMANDEGQQRLRAAAKEKQMAIDWDEGNDTHLDVAMKVWMADEDLFRAKHNEQWLMGLTRFKYFGTKVPVDARPKWVRPTESIIALMKEEIEEWCSKNNRGAKTVDVQMCDMDGEFWFLIQHGGTKTRTPKVENWKKEILHYRPAKDDVVVYSVLHDEIRICTNSKAELDLYRGVFGQRLRGDADFFLQKKAYTLNPLRDNLEAALSPGEMEGVKEILLQQLEVRYGGDFRDTTVYRSDDLVKSAMERSKKKGKAVRAVPESGDLVRATFALIFEGGEKPRTFTLRTSDELMLTRQDDALMINEWLTKQKYRAAEETVERWKRKRRKQ